jgi:hypothetical protein
MPPTELKKTVGSSLRKSNADDRAVVTMITFRFGTTVPELTFGDGNEGCYENRTD